MIVTGLKLNDIRINKQVRSDKSRLKACSPREVRELRDAALAGIQDRRWRTQLGYLFLTGKIEAPQAEAGRRFADDDSQYRRALRSPAATAKSARLEQGINSHEPDISSNAGKMEVAADVEAVATFKVLVGLVCHGVSPMRQSAFLRTFRDICGDERAVAGQEEFAQVDKALTRLAYHYGLIVDAKRKPK